ncbi:MAG TPA: ATP-dependent zinc metalloprotease FtsH [Steroidobacteraceae bacterium]|nr:ATP-dependent zinc metalloprotease FtsH [Steroidobacteraceae bacterium]
MENKHQFTLWYYLGAIILLFAVQSYFARDHVGVLPYSDFKTLVQAGKVHDVTIGSETIVGTVDLTGVENLLPAATIELLKKQAAAQPAPAVPAGQASAQKPAVTQHRIVARRVEDPQLTAMLDAAKVRYTAAAENRWFSTLLSWILPAVVFVGIWNFMLRRGGMGGHMGGMMEIGQSKAKVYVQSQTGVRFADVAGIDEAKEELMEIVEFLRNPDRYRRLGGKIPKGVLIVGAPGTGKTLLAKAVAGEAEVPFLSISGSEFVEMFVGVGAARVRDLFAQAEKKAPCIIFIDELDALGKARGFSGLAGHDEREQTLNQLLVQMDGFDTKNGVIIMAATNRPEILDPALLRPGRFDRHVAIDRPDIKGREAILKVHSKNVTLAPDVDLATVAAKTAGFAGADLANIVNEAALRAARRNKSAVDMKDFEDAIDRVVAGLEKRNRVMNPTEKETVAYHEAGHALIAESRRYADRVSKISIIPRGIAALGYTQQLPTEDRYLLKRSELLDRLDVLLGGRVAEEIVYGDISTGAQNDLQRATDMARHMITQYGMSERLGHVTFEAPRPSAFLNVPDLSQRAAYSENTARLIDEEVAKLVAEAHERVKRTLIEKRATLDALAALLLKEEVVERTTLDELLKKSGSAPTSPAPESLPLAAAFAVERSGLAIDAHHG